MLLRIAAMAILCGAVAAGCRSGAEQTAGWVPIEKDGLWGYQDQSGQDVLPPKYFVAYPFLETGIAAVADEQGWVYINAQGTELIRPFIFDNGPDAFSEGMARFEREGKFGYFNRQGTIVIAPRFDFAHSFQNGRAAICLGCRRVPDGEHFRIEGGEWHWIDRQGQITGQLAPGEKP